MHGLQRDQRQNGMNKHNFSNISAEPVEEET